MQRENSSRSCVGYVTGSLVTYPLYYSICLKLSSAARVDYVMSLMYYTDQHV
ncbi:hypothetical protein CIB48_g11450, partial [Xylaria polymorpha]